MAIECDDWIREEQEGEQGSGGALERLARAQSPHNPNTHIHTHSILNFTNRAAFMDMHPVQSHRAPHLI